MSQIDLIFKTQKIFYETQVTKSLDFRINALKKLHAGIKKYEEEINHALQNDLNKSAFDSYITEIGFVLEEISFMLKRLKTWSKPTRVKTALTHIGTKGYRYPEPYGVVLIIAPWNYPFQLAMSPLIGAIAAGNCVILKPSELSNNTSRVINKIISNLFEDNYVCVVEGNATVSKSLLDLPFDYIFFTGSERVGKLVMAAAAKHLTPITLELGGKSPVIVCPDADLKLAAKRIVWGKFLNAGQTCVAPDYIYAHKSILEKLVEQMKLEIEVMFTANALTNDQYTRIISKSHFDRMINFLKEGNIVIGGDYDESIMKLQPTIIIDLDWNSKVMGEEIFGPILPVLSFDSIVEPITAIRNHGHPLACYLFAKNAKVINQVIKEVECGGMCVNDVIYHLATPYLPFGGKGNSGLGAYHGKASFDTFTHYKSILKQTTLFDIPFRYPNFKGGLSLIRKFLK